MNRKHEFIESRVILTDTVTEDDSFEVNFSNVEPTKGDLRGYVVGVDFKMAVTVAANAAQADLPEEAIHGLLYDLEINRAKHRYLPEMLSGCDLRGISKFDGCNRKGHTDLDEQEDLDKDTASHTVLQTWCFRCAPDFLGLWRDQGVVKGKTSDLSDAVALWAFDGSATLEVIVHILWTPRMLVSRPHVITKEQVTASPQNLNPIEGKCDLLYVRDEADPVPGAFTDAGGDIKVQIDDLVLVEEQTLTEATYFNSLRCDVEMTDVAPFGGRLLISPPQADNRIGMIDTAMIADVAYGTRHRLLACQNNGGTALAVRRIYMDPDREQMVLWAAAMGITLGADAKDHLVLASKQKVGGQVTEAMKLCQQHEWI